MKKHFRQFILLTCAIAATLALASCATQEELKQRADGSYILRPPAGTAPIFEPVPDALQGYNRSIQHFNATTIKYVASPLSRFWEFVIPPTIRIGIHNFSTNLKFPLHFTSNLLQGKFENCWDETMRFCINSTLGIGGLCDWASDFGFEPHQTGFSEVLAFYGVPHVSFFNLPFLGPSTVRDTIGIAMDIPFNLMGYVLPDGAGTGASILCKFNDITPSMPSFEQFMDCNYDSYMMTKAFYIIRDHALRNPPKMMTETFGPTGEFQPCDRTLNVLNIRLRDRKYYYQGITRRADIGDGCFMPYSCWPNRDKKHLAIILPGLGGHRLSETVVYLGETMSQYNVNVITLSPTLSPDYFLNLPEVVPQGNFKEDSKTLAHVLDAVIKDFKARYELDEDCHVSVIGYSLGAINTMYLADMQYNGTLPESLRIDDFISINPPIDVLSALQTIDEFFEIPHRWPEEKRDQIVNNIFSKLAVLMFMPPEAYEVCPLTMEESQFLIGLQLRISLSESIMALEDHCYTGMIGEPADKFNKNQFWIEAMNIPATEYVTKWVLPYYTQNAQLSDDDMLREIGSLRSLEPSLRNNHNNYIIHCDDDFLLQPGDVQWLKNCLGSRLALFKGLGHIGEIPTPGFDNTLFSIIMR